MSSIRWAEHLQAVVAGNLTARAAASMRRMLDASGYYFHAKLMP
jgi:hypothetical protein